MDTQNSGPSARSIGRPFPKGQSGNPGGRPKGLSASVQAVCGSDGKKLLQALYAIALGTAKERRDIFGPGVKVTTRDRREAIKELLDRGWGKPIQAIEHSGPEGGPIETSGLSADEIAARAEALAARLRSTRG